MFGHKIPVPPEPVEKNKGIQIPVSVDTKEIDEVILKAKELVALLQEANELIESLSKK